MNLWPIGLGTTVFVLGLWTIVRAERQKHMGSQQTRGRNPGVGHIVNHITMDFGGNSGTHSFTTRHSKDPQEHALKMMPRHLLKKDKGK